MPNVSPLASVSATREVLDAHSLSTKYSLGQNFLVSDGVLGRIVELSEVCDRDYVLEVGPGIGTLTLALLPRAAHVTSVEFDKDLPAVLADTCAPYAEKFTLISKDAMNLVPDELGDPKPNKLIANLPYQVAATLVLDYFQRFDFLQSVTVMVQKEVADRMCAKVGVKDYGAYTVKLRLHAKPVGRFPVSAGNFFPPPRVESAVVRFDRLSSDEPLGALTHDERHWACIMADAAFASRRKTISNSCKSYFSRYNGRYDVVLTQLPQILEQAGIDPRRRGETLEIEDFVQLGCFVKAVID